MNMEQEKKKPMTASERQALRRKRTNDLIQENAERIHSLTMRNEKLESDLSAANAEIDALKLEAKKFKERIKKLQLKLKAKDE